MEKEIHEKDDDEEKEEEDDDSEEAAESSSRLDKEEGESSEEERSVSEKEDKEEEGMSSDKPSHLQHSMSDKPPDSMSGNQKHHIKVDDDKREVSEESEGKEEHKEESKEESKEAGEGTRGGGNLQGLQKGQGKDMVHGEGGGREESGAASLRKQAETPKGSEASEEATNHLGAKMTPVITELQLERLCK